jgi:leucyl-tRNA synthetase
MYTLFAAPPEKDLEWSEEAIEGSARFLNKIYRLFAKYAESLRSIPMDLSKQTDMATASAKEKILVRRTHQTLKRVTNDFESRWHFNTSVSALMSLLHDIQEQEPLDAGVSPALLKRVFAAFALMLAPIAPHMAEELWEMLGNSRSLAHEKWPAYREDLTKEEQIEVIVQINGRLRGKILVGDGMSEDETLELALKDPRISMLLDGKKIVKTIVVPKKLVNIVVR